MSMSQSNKSFEEYLDFIENKMGIKLLAYQKEIMRHCYDQKNIYVVYPPHAGRTDFRMLYTLMETLFKEN